MNIFGIRVYILVLPIIDPVTKVQVTKCLMWDGKRWWTSPQTGLSNAFIASQDFNSTLTAYQSSIVATTTAAGTIFLPTNPTSGQTVTLNSVAFTFVNGSPTGNQVQIGGTTALTAFNLVAALTASVNPDITVASYAWTGGPNTALVTITYNTAGTAGNAYTLAASNAVTSGATLSGGANSATISPMFTTPGNNFGKILYSKLWTNPGIFLTKWVQQMHGLINVNIVDSPNPGFVVAPLTEAGEGNAVQLSPAATGAYPFGPLPVGANGRLVGMFFYTTMSDIQVNEIDLIGRIAVSNT
jgi:hypothetical protein